MKYFKIHIKYDGSAYCGWQIQPNGISIQHVIETVLSRLANQPVRIHGAGRTDAGVHALDQVAHFQADTNLDATAFQKGLNGLLPSDIIATSVRECSSEFHARYSACGKYYLYIVQNGMLRSLILRNYSAYSQCFLDIQAMHNAAQSFVGTHNFKPFSANAGREHERYERTIHQVLIESHPPFIIFHVLGQSFLYKMVRLMVGTLLDVGRGKIPPDTIANILSTGDTLLVGTTAPAHGLFLKKVYYSEIQKISPADKKCNFLPLFDVLNSGEI
ncbi:MAG: tRNA pseudouridine(38-40) synthase TruA [bacterium]|nr:tRNA pseudouridine(38-40) synthase TruA [bacterium]